MNNECEIRTKDLLFHERVYTSLSMRQVLKSTHDADWSLLKDRIGNNDYVGDWATRHMDGGVYVKPFEQMTQEGKLGKATVPSQVYCIVRYLLTGGDTDRVRSGLVLGEFTVDEDLDNKWLEGIIESIQPPKQVRCDG